MKTDRTSGAGEAPRIGTLLRETERLLQALPQASPRLEAELLLCDATGLGRTTLLAWPDVQIGERDWVRFQTLVRRRLTGEPIAYLRGRQAFWTLELVVTPDTLIPRPETELLVEVALDQLPAETPLLILDAGCGSGAVAAALAAERPAWTLIATDLSMGALQVARINLWQYMRQNALLINCSWLAPIAERSLHALLANPPYIPDSDPHLSQGDLPFEPRNALIAGPDGLEAIRILSAQAATRLRPVGFIALEHGYDQGSATRAILSRQGFEDLHTYRDMSGHERITSGRLPA